MSKVWFFTGAGSGIGAGAVKSALKAGDRVVGSPDKLGDALVELTRMANPPQVFIVREKSGSLSERRRILARRTTLRT
jgi:NAD(P)-dependent dehydrogenase (short-subunit alcohol dehydrogenase family)